MLNRLHGHCLADGLDGVYQASLGVPGPIPKAFKQKHDFPGISPLEVILQVIRSWPSVCHQQTCRACCPWKDIPSPAHDPALWSCHPPKHACPCHCPAITEARPCRVPTAPALPLPSHREWPQQRTGDLRGPWLVITRVCHPMIKCTMHKVHSYLCP